MQKFLDVLKEKILVLDGAMGTLIQQYQLQEVDYRKGHFENHDHALKGNHDVLNLTRPDVLMAIHQAYIEAGADVIETNTFNANALSQEDYGLADQVTALNREAVGLAKAAIAQVGTNRPVFVAGSMGPTNKTLSLSPKVEDPAYRAVDFDDMVKAYYDQAHALVDADADLLLLETVFDTLSARAALLAIDQAQNHLGTQVPVVVSGTLTDLSGRSLAGQTLEAFFESLDHPRVVAFGMNCSFGAKELVPYVKRLRKITDKYLCVYPNAGLPNQLGAYDELPETTLKELETLFDDQIINMVGGCCGTTPAHIKAIANRVKNEKPYAVNPMAKPLILAGLETRTLDETQNFINIGERTNVAGSKKFARLIREKAYDDALAIAKDQIETGAQIIDINFDDALLDAKSEMTYFLRLFSSEPDCAKVPVMIDSSDFEVIKAGLKAIHGRVVVNSISLKNGQEAFIKEATYIKQFNAAVVVMAFDEKGQADTFERKIDVCERAYRLLVDQVGFKPEAIIFDPNILTVGTGMKEHDNYGVDFIRATQWIKKCLPKAKVSGGVSNLSFAFRGRNDIREAMHAVFLYHATQAGMDMGIVNAASLLPYDVIEPDLRNLAEDLVLNKRPDALEWLLAFSASHQEKESATTSQVAQWKTLDPQARLIEGLVRGTSDCLNEDLHHLLNQGHLALNIIEGPLMEGLKVVGDRFQEGKMFLPQVVKTARTMKEAVAILKPFIEGQQTSQDVKRAGKVLLATVKGDVHDIGKNIVGVVLGCNHFEVIDLGIMVSADQIIEAIHTHKPQVVGLSGLITPSLEEMRVTIEAIRKAHLDVPIIVGGATTSPMHTALKLAPEFPKHVLHATDASKTVLYCKQIVNQNQKQALLDAKHLEYQALRQQYQDLKQPLVAYKEAYQNVKPLGAQPLAPKQLGVFSVAYGVETLRKTIDWTFFFTSWGLKKAYPQILEDSHYGKEAQQLYQDANSLLDAFENLEQIAPKGVYGLFKVKKQASSLELEDGTTFNFLRQQGHQSCQRSLIDYIEPDQDHAYLGCFAVTAGQGIENLYQDYKAKGDDYMAMLTKLLADRLAESFAEKLHLDIRKDHWAYAPNENLDLKDLLKGRYQGIRPAFGYPSLPDHSEKATALRVLNASEHTGITLTESYMMTPSSSVCGLIFAHPDSAYFDLGKIGQDQLESYAKAKNKSLEDMKKLLSAHIYD